MFLIPIAEKKRLISLRNLNVEQLRFHVLRTLATLTQTICDLNNLKKTQS